MRFRTVLFDLDGTLIDSGPIILASFRHAARTVLQREVVDDEILANVGGMHIREHMAVLAPDRVDELVTAYTEHNTPLQSSLEAFPGVLDLLATLAAQGRRLGIVSSKRRSTIASAFAVLPLERFFDTVVGVEDSDRHKPHPEPILLALERLGSATEDAAYVGDSPFDVQAARAAGVFAVGVSWGGIHPRERLEREVPDLVVDSPGELLGHL
jgi:pyrophosphatase PpaX